MDHNYVWNKKNRNLDYLGTNVVVGGGGGCCALSEKINLKKTNSKFLEQEKIKEKKN